MKFEVSTSLSKKSKKSPPLTGVKNTQTR